MEPLSISEITSATNGILFREGKAKVIRNLCTDTRKLKRGDFFLAIKGDKFDGHNFISVAIKKGASGIIINQNKLRPHLLFNLPNTDTTIISVVDTIISLGDLAKYYRKKFSIPVIAITGSNGKTTTKDMLAHILKFKYEVLKNEGTENNHIGVPLTLLRLTRKHKAAVIEMGMNHLGEIRRLTNIALPTIGIITNIGPSHLQFLKNLETVLQAKCELLENFDRRNLAVLNSDDGLLAQAGNFSAKKVLFGIYNHGDFTASGINYKRNSSNFLVNYKYEIELSVPGEHNVYNALATIAVARELKISYEDIRKALKSFKSLQQRLNIKSLKGIHLIDDCYNSNPLSMRCALQTITSYAANRRKIVVSGDMLELGQFSPKFHKDIGRLIAKLGIDYLITVGSLSKHMSGAALKAGMPKSQVLHFNNKTQAAQELKSIIEPQDVVLIKGSRAIKMEEIISHLTG